MSIECTPADNLEQLASGQPAKWIPFSLDLGAKPGLTNPIMKRFREETGAEDPRRKGRVTKQSLAPSTL